MYWLEDFAEGTFSSQKDMVKAGVPNNYSLTDEQSDTVGNNDALILSSFPSNADDIYIGSYTNLNNTLNNFNKYDFDATLKFNATVEDYMTLLDDYGMVFINSHGSFFDGRFPVICLEQTCNVVNLIKYSYELWHGLLVTYGGVGVIGGQFAITPNFISFYYENTMPNTLVYMCICHGIENNQLANAFISAGAGAVTGFTDSVKCLFDRDILNTYIDELLNGRTTGEAYDEAIEVNGTNDEDSSPAYFTLIGNNSLRILNSTIVNPSFELSNFYGWSKYGDVRAISKLGLLAPIDGQKMAIISTGLGAVNNSNSYIEQTFNVNSSLSKLTIEYDFVSEEPMEYVNSSYDDNLYISIIDETGNEEIFVTETVNSSTWEYLGEDYFTGGDKTTYHTGWKKKTIDLSKYRGKFITLKVRVFDVGDSAYDSAVLIDNIVMK